MIEVSLTYEMQLSQPDEEIMTDKQNKVDGCSSKSITGFSSLSEVSYKQAKCSHSGVKTKRNGGIMKYSHLCTLCNCRGTKSSWTLVNDKGPAGQEALLLATLHCDESEIPLFIRTLVSIICLKLR
ncbi:hypothetical protein POUND7_017495 [Theobroma cacao]